MTTIVTIRLMADKNTDQFGAIIVLDPQNSLMPPLSITTGLSDTPDAAMAAAGERLSTLIRQHGTLKALYEARSAENNPPAGFKPLDIRPLEDKLRKHIVTDTDKADMQQKGYAVEEGQMHYPERGGEPVTVFSPHHRTSIFPPGTIFTDEGSCWSYMYLDYAVHYLFPRRDSSQGLEFFVSDHDSD